MNDNYHVYTRINPPSINISKNNLNLNFKFHSGTIHYSLFVTLLNNCGEALRN